MAIYPLSWNNPKAINNILQTHLSRAFHHICHLSWNFLPLFALTMLWLIILNRSDSLLRFVTWDFVCLYCAEIPVCMGLWRTHSRTGFSINNISSNKLFVFCWIRCQVVSLPISLLNSIQASLFLISPVYFCRKPFRYGITIYLKV